MTIRKSIKLAPLSTFGIGGRAEFFCRVKSPEDFVRAVEWARNRKIPYKVFAGGSNVVFSDKKTKGLVIQILGGKIQRIARNKLLADSGVLLSDLIKKAIAWGLRGIESLSGIPGTVGGAIFGNAGAYGQSVSDKLLKVEIWDPFGGARGKVMRRWVSKNHCYFAYRESIFGKKPYLILRAIFEFERSNQSELKKISNSIIETRLKKYPSELKCLGSFFKNILIKDLSNKVLSKIDKAKIIGGKIPAGYLLEEIGAKGMKLGRIKVADYHGNLLINQGRATAKDVKRLSNILKAKVRKRFGIELKEEVRYF